MLNFGKKRSRAIPATVLVAMLLSPIGAGMASAASESGGFAVRGLGAQTCIDITEALEGASADRVVQTASSWIAGYVSHYNRSADQTYEAIPIIDNSVVARLALNICRSNPEELFESVAASLISIFSDGALSRESEMIEVGEDGAGTTRLRREVFRKVQLELIDAGFLSAGAADGYYGPRSRVALTEFQKSRGMTETGIPDPATLIMLFASGEEVSEDDNTQ